jgi:hypothetical protein
VSAQDSMTTLEALAVIEANVNANEMVRAAKVLAPAYRCQQAMLDAARDVLRQAAERGSDWPPDYTSLSEAVRKCDEANHG